METPPIEVMRELKVLGKQAPACRKSHRRVVIYDRQTLLVRGCGVNMPPSPMSCDGSPECRQDCAKICIHAEAMAINAVLYFAAHTGKPSTFPPTFLVGFDLVHGKFMNGELVAGGGPSCWQCSKQILELGVGHVWLYEQVTLETMPPQTRPEWRRYQALEFHRATLANNGLWDNLR